MNREIKKILLDHGAGGRASHELTVKVFLPILGGQDPDILEDCAVLDPGPGRLAFSTDTFVVDPIFFPGGDIGDLAVNGTVNDIAMRGARPKYLSTGFILEEGLPVSDLKRILESMARAARTAGVRIAAGDTKVVPRGAADKIFINTAGIGIVPDGVNISASRAGDGDVVILSGTMGDHGLAVLCQREGLSLSSPIKSDTACLAGMVEDVLRAGGDAVHVLRDPTRGGVGATLNEIAASSKAGVLLWEEKLPIAEEVQGACDILGLDPFYAANEGKMLVLVAPEAASRVLEAIKAHPLGGRAEIIGRVDAGRPGRVVLNTLAGGTRIIDTPIGEQLPRIC